MTPTRVIAYGGIPQDNGVFSHFRALRAGLRRHGWRVLCVSVGEDAKRRWQSDFVDDGCVNIPVTGDSPQTSAKAFANWCLAQQVSVVIPEHVPEMLAALQHLPPEIRVVHACMDLFPEALRLYREIIGNVDLMVAATPRQRWELSRWNVPSPKLALIPFAASDDDFYTGPPKSRAAGAPLRIAWVARMNHHQKGVRWVPPIIQELRRANVDLRIQICGDGAERKWLEQQLSRLLPSPHYSFVGKQPPAKVGELLRESHVYLLPTRYEGFGISIIEAMMAGCVPVVTSLCGVTDSFIKNETDGRLCRLGSIRSFSQAILELSRDDVMLERLRTSAQRTALHRHSFNVLGDRYNSVLEATLAQPCARRAGVPWTVFEPHWSNPHRTIVQRLLHGRFERWLLDRREIRLSESGMVFN